MQIVISISESFYDRLINMNSDNDTCSFNESALVASIQNGTPIPDNATNGDVIKAMFNEEDIWDIQTALNLYVGTIGWWYSLYCED